MFLSQIKTFIPLLVVISSLCVSMSARATSESVQKYSDSKKRLSSKNSTSAKGGFSDGGGNYVGKQLFDFYENEGSEKVTVTDLQKLEPLVEKILTMLNKTVPFTNGPDTPAFGTSIKNTLAEKALYLEPKKITAIDCINTSSVGSADQGVAACQGSDEVRFYLPWLLDEKVTPEDRAGLIVHEMILAWAFDVHNYHRLDQDEMERRVRILNRAIFFPDSTPLAETIRKLFRVDSFASAEANVLRAMRKEVAQASLAFCRNPRADVTASLSQYESSAAYNRGIKDYEIISRLQGLIETKNIKSEYFVKSEAYLSFCEEAVIKYSPIREPDLKRIPESCQIKVKTLINADRERIKQIALQDLDFYLDEENHMALNLGKTCKWEQTTIREVANYYKYLVRDIVLNKK